MSEELLSKLKRYEEVVSFSSVVNSSLEFSNIVKLARKEIKKIFKAGHICLYRAEQNGTLLKSIGDSTYEYTHKNSVHNFVGACAHYASILHIQDISGDIRYLRESEHIKTLAPKEMMLAPLFTKGELLGVIQVIGGKDQNFTKLDIDLLEVIESHLTLAMHNAILFEKLNSNFFQVCETLGDAIVKKDIYTGGHTKRVCHFTEMIAAEMDLDTNEKRNLQLAAILHDIGKIGIEDSILKKAAPLTDKEFSIMKEHPRLGYEILGHIEGLKDVVAGIRYHHERPDGKGYPYGLTGDKIPLAAKIISVADTFDAMISTRPYRKGLPPMQAYEEIIKYSGKQFDSKVVEAFVRAFEKTPMFRPTEKNIKEAI